MSQATFWTLCCVPNDDSNVHLPQQYGMWNMDNGMVLVLIDINGLFSMIEAL